MQLTGNITADNLMTLEAYSKFRKENKAAVLAHRKLRSVHLGENFVFQFESETTIRYHIQQEIDAYAPLVPDGTNWKATMLIEYIDVNERKRELARLIGVEDRCYVEVEGLPRIYAIADEDLDRETEEKTSAVHFVRFEFTPAMIAALRAGGSAKLGCDHSNYPAHTVIAPETLASLAGDLKA